MQGCTYEFVKTRSGNRPRAATGYNEFHSIIQGPNVVDGPTGDVAGTQLDAGKVVHHDHRNSLSANHAYLITFYSVPRRSPGTRFNTSRVYIIPGFQNTSKFQH